MGLCGEEDLAAFRLVSEIERYLRVTLRWELRGRRPRDWAGLISQEAVREAERRALEERGLRYMDAMQSSILSYMTISELRDVILGPAWSLAFAQTWPPVELVKSDFKKLIAVRNKVAHFRSISERDFRLARRFAEDLADWTKDYQRLRAYRRQIVPHLDESAVARLKVANVVEFLREARDPEHRISGLYIVGHHYCFELECPNQAFRPTAIKEHLDRFDSAVTFCRIGELGDRLAFYVPRDCEKEVVDRFLAETLTAATNTSEGLSSAEVRVQFGLAERETLLPWEVDVPANFRFPLGASSVNAPLI